MTADIIPARRRSHRLRAVALGLCLAVGGGLWWAGAPFRADAQTPSPAVGVHKVQGAAWRPDLGQPLFIAVLGSDIRNGPPGGPGGRCDALHIVAINPAQKAGSVIDIPRDSWVEVPGRGMQRINTGCFYGGPELQVETMKRVTGIPIQYYVTTEFSNFMAFIDAVGGVDVNVPYAMSDPASGAFFQPGPQRLGGGASLAFNRNRKSTPNGDFSRTENQGTYIIATLAKFRSESQDPHRIFDYIKAARQHVKVTIPINEMLKMALLAQEIDPANLRHLPVRGSTGMAGEASVVFMDPGDIFTRVKDDAIY